MPEPFSVDIADGVKLVRNVLIPTRDGVRLAADLYMPEDAGPDARFPAVMEYTPYRKDDVDLESRSFYLTLPRHGYVVARVDIRGTGGSGGISTDEYTLQEQHDGYDAVEWIAGQPWCDGQVNMMGISYGGFTALQVASHNPPHLTSIIPIDFTDDRYTDDCHYRGGLMRMYYDIAYYGGQMVARNALPPDPDGLGGEWARVWEQHLAHNEPYLLKWYRHQTDGAYWRCGSVCDAPESIRCPVFLIGGWRDGYMNPPLRLYRALQVPCKVLVGPWNHALPDVAVPGPRIDYLREVIRWLDHWCKRTQTSRTHRPLPTTSASVSATPGATELTEEQDVGIMDQPPVVVYMQHYQPPEAGRLDAVGEWRAETDWPPPGAGEMTLYLGDGYSLSDRPPISEHADAYRYTPTVGVTGGLWSGGLPFGLPGDQRPDEAFSLFYTTRPLSEDLHILGRPRAVLHVSSSASVMGFVVSLCDVAPDGTSHLVAKGMLNATRRDSFSDSRSLTPGESYELDIPIDCTGWVFARGHRVRLNVASADWPNVWPTPELATNHVYRGGERPSRLVLPTVPAQGSATPPPLRPSPKMVRWRSDAVCPPTWRVTHDLLTGQKTVDIGLRSSWRLHTGAVVERESHSEFEIDPGDPAHASARGRHVYRIARAGLVTQACAEVVVQGAVNHFHVTIDLEVRINDVLHFTRRWVESVPRQGL